MTATANNTRASVIASDGTLYEILEAYFSAIQSPGPIHALFAHEVERLWWNIDKSPLALVPYPDPALPLEVPLTISSCAQSHYISRLQSDTTWQKQQLIILRTTTEIGEGVVKSTKQTTGCDKARRGSRKTEVSLLQDGGDEAEWRLLWPTPISLVAMADYASRYAALQWY